MQTFALIACLAGMLLALAAVLVPALPGLAVIWLIILGYGYFENWQSYGLAFVLLSGFLAGLGMLLDQVATVLGAKKFGAGYPGMVGAFVGALLGLLLLALPGLVLGTFVGALLGELFWGKNLKASSYAGLGAVLGFIGGTMGKFILGLIMTGGYIYLTLVK